MAQSFIFFTCDILGSIDCWSALAISSSLFIRPLSAASAARCSISSLSDDFIRSIASRRHFTSLYMTFSGSGASKFPAPISSAATARRFSGRIPTLTTMTIPTIIRIKPTEIRIRIGFFRCTKEPVTEEYGVSV